MSGTPSSSAVKEKVTSINATKTNKKAITQAIVERIGIQYDKENLTDVTVIVDGKEFPSHRFILSACSGFFQALFVSGMKEDRERRVEITGISQTCFSSLLDFVFKGKDVVNEESVVELWHADNQLDVSILLEQCEAFIIENINAKNCLPFYLNAKILDRIRIKNISWRILLKNFNSVWDSDDILELSLDDAKLLVRSSDLNVRSEDHVVDFILRWTSYTPTCQEECYSGLDESDDTENDKEKPTAEIDSIQTATDDGILKSQEEEKGEEKEKKEGREKDENETKIEIGQAMDTVLYEPRPDNSPPETSNPNSSSLTQSSNNVNTFCEHEGDLKNENGARTDQTSTRQVQDKFPEKRSRSHFLSELLSCARICLIGGNVLAKLLNEQTILSNAKAMSFIKESIRYQMEPARRHDYCPSTAIHRTDSSRLNVTICFKKPSEIRVYVNDEDHDLFSFGKQLDVCTSTMFNNNLYLGDNSGDTNVILKCNCLKESWVTLSNLPDFGSGYAMVAVDDYVYVIGGTECNVERINAYTDGDWETVGTLPIALTNTAATVFGSNIIALGCAEDQNDVTVVQCFDTESMTSYQMDDIGAPPQRVATFKKGTETFVLFRTGALWKLEMTDAGRMFIRYITLLWDFDRSLTGAVLYRDELILYGDKASSQVGEKWVFSVPGVFNSIRNVVSQGQCFHIAEVRNRFLKPATN